jgi:Nif-specific regulatory protein
MRTKNGEHKKYTSNISFEDNMKDSIQRAETELRILYLVSQAMAHERGVASLLDRVLDVLETEMAMSRGTFTLRNADSDIFQIEATRIPEEAKQRGRYRLGEGITGKVASTGKPVIVPDIRNEPEFLNRTQTRKDVVTAFICVPIIHQSRVIGTLSVDRSTAPTEELERDESFLKLLADLLAEVVYSIREGLAARESLLAENRKLRMELGDKYRPANIIGNCHSMRVIYEQIAQVADSSATVLIRGGSGSGKELVARAIHFSSPRKNNPFICVNVAALPESLIESELFGHEKGAFTGAQSQRLGRFEMANGGTLFLDEIGDISTAVQVRLLRVLQERCFERVGGMKPVDVNVRIIAATSVNLEQAITDNRFREDLYYRLNVFPIILPPLRERKSDIMLLADHFVQKYNKIHNKNIKRISSAAINMMMAYHWPGNVRELENCIERAVLTSNDSVIHAYTLPPSLQTDEQTSTKLIPTDGADLKAMVNAYEREIIIDALKKNRGSASAAARYLNTTQRILNYRINQLQINRSYFKIHA